MLLALDVGNTNIVIGFLDESGIRNIARLETDRDKTAHEYAISLRQVIEFSGIAPENIDGAILSSVVPPINGALIAAICAAPSILGHKGSLENRQAVCFPGFEDELYCAVY